MGILIPFERIQKARAVKPGGGMSMGVYIKNWSLADWKELLKWAKIGANNAMIGEFAEVEELQPHGRLIDADKMRESIRRQAGFLKLMGGELSKIAETLEKGFLQEIANAPTIIPAEPCNNLSKPCKEDES